MEVEEFAGSIVHGREVAQQVPDVIFFLQNLFDSAEAAGQEAIVICQDKNEASARFIHHLEHVLLHAQILFIPIGPQATVCRMLGNNLRRVIRRAVVPDQHLEEITGLRQDARKATIKLARPFVGANHNRKQQFAHTRENLSLIFQA